MQICSKIPRIPKHFPTSKNQLFMHSKLPLLAPGRFPYLGTQLKLNSEDVLLPRSYTKTQAVTQAWWDPSIKGPVSKETLRNGHPAGGRSKKPASPSLISLLHPVPPGRGSISIPIVSSTCWSVAAAVSFAGVALGLRGERSLHLWYEVVSGVLCTFLNWLYVCFDVCIRNETQVSCMFCVIDLLLLCGNS